MKNVMILSGGTSTAWHIAVVLKKYFSDSVRLIICDINPRYLVHTSVLADKYLQVPLIKSPDYYAVMLQHMKEEQVDVLIPLIDDDIMLFSGNNPDLTAINVMSIAPSRDTIQALSNKEHLSATLGKMGITTPRVFNTPDELECDRMYFVKDAVGCGSRGTELLSGREASVLMEQEGKVVQEVCQKPEITVDVVRDGETIHTICREREEIKLGVSTKCKVYFDPEIQQILEIIAAHIELPSVFCVQFMKNADGKWALIDFNLRSGGGTAISAAVGFQALRFAAAGWLGLPAQQEWLCVPQQERYVVRAYEEIVTK